MAIGGVLGVQEWPLGQTPEVDGVKTYGYFMKNGDAATAEALLLVIARRCSDEGWRLGAVYGDTGGDDEVERVNLNALVAALEREENSCRVVVPSLDYLSSLPTVRTAILARLSSLGADVVAVEDA